MLREGLDCQLQFGNPLHPQQFQTEGPALKQGKDDVESISVGEVTANKAISRAILQFRFYTVAVEEIFQFGRKRRPGTFKENPVSRVRPGRTG